MIGEISTAAKAATTVAVAIASFWGGMTAMDSRYEMKEVHQPAHAIITTGMDNFSITVLKKEIREIRNALRNATDPQHIQQLKYDLEDSIGRLCQLAPNDRECR